MNALLKELFSFLQESTRQHDNTSGTITDFIVLKRKREEKKGRKKKRGSVGVRVLFVFFLLQKD
jgi:hypothetical protein